MTTSRWCPNGILGTLDHQVDLAHLPSGVFAANAAWLTYAAITHNVLRAPACLASAFHARARDRHAAPSPHQCARRIARHGRGHLTLHLPIRWRWQTAWTNAFTATHGLPATRPD